MSITGSLVYQSLVRPNTAPARLGQSQLSFRGESAFPSSFVQVQDDSDGDGEGGDAASGGDQRHVGVSLGGGDRFPTGSAGSDAAVPAETASVLVESASKSQRTCLQQTSPRHLEESPLFVMATSRDQRNNSQPQRRGDRKRVGSPPKRARSLSRGQEHSAYSAKEGSVGRSRSFPLLSDILK